MKQPKKLTREQKEIVAGHYLNPKDWAFVEETDFSIIVCRKDKPEIKKMLDKYKRMKRGPQYGKYKFVS